MPTTNTILLPIITASQKDYLYAIKRNIEPQHLLLHTTGNLEYIESLIHSTMYHLKCQESLK